MKNIVIVNSTFRNGGNSQVLASEFERGAKESGHNVKTINLKDLDLKFCIGCLACQKMGKCVLKDDVNDLLSTVQNADILVFATPVYYYCMSGQLKTFLDRLNPLFPKQNKFKDVYLIATCAEDEESAIDGTINGVQGWIDCFDGVRLAGVVYGIGVESVGEVKNTIAFKQAYEMGKSI